MVAVIYPDEKSPRCVEMESNRFPREHASLTLGKLMVINPSDVPASQQKHFIMPGTILEEKILTDASGRYYLGTPSFKAIIVGKYFETQFLFKSFMVMAGLGRSPGLRRNDLYFSIDPKGTFSCQRQ